MRPERTYEIVKLEFDAELDRLNPSLSSDELDEWRRRRDALFNELLLLSMRRAKNVMVIR